MIVPSYRLYHCIFLPTNYIIVSSNRLIISLYLLTDWLYHCIFLPTDYIIVSSYQPMMISLYVLTHWFYHCIFLPTDYIIVSSYRPIISLYVLTDWLYHCMFLPTDYIIVSSHRPIISLYLLTDWLYHCIFLPTDYIIVFSHRPIRVRQLYMYHCILLLTDGRRSVIWYERFKYLGVLSFEKRRKYRKVPIVNSLYGDTYFYFRKSCIWVLNMQYLVALAWRKLTNRIFKLILLMRWFYITWC